MRLPFPRYPPDMPSGRSVLFATAPAAAEALTAVEATLWHDAAATGCADVLVQMATAAAGVHELPALAQPAWAKNGVPTRPTAPGPIFALVTQAAADVAQVTEEQRAAFLAAAGPSAGTLTAGLWAVDLLPRVWAGLDALFGPDDWPPADRAAADPAGAWAAIDGVIRIVPALDAVDPVTAELVRLRVARAHRCRLCMSIRDRRAVRDGATEGVLDGLDGYADGRFGPAATAALQLTDALLWTPGRIAPATVEAARAALSEAQQVEVVLDVARNALNKVAVAFGADTPHVTEGIELYEVAADGSLAYGLDPL